MQKTPRLRAWESYEIDIQPDKYFDEVEKAKEALREHDEMRIRLERKLWGLENGSFYSRSKMRAMYPESYEAAYRED